MSDTKKLIPIYNSRGEAAAFLLYPNIYNVHGEWIGWVTQERKVYSIYGHYVGILSNEPRILRQREWAYNEARVKTPEPAPPIRPPLRVPLAPLMAEIRQNYIDVLEEAPDLLPAADFGDLRDDLD
ncbi:MAG: hypothetical protein JXB15_12995 [Anaerolineales bacterium]|nr:hypothetical protein [Anaerolineales bacterium]